VIVDPVLVNHRGRPMFDPSVTEAYRRHLLPLADLATPNLAEAALLLDRLVKTAGQQAQATRDLVRLGPTWALLKGRRQAGAMHDVLSDGRRALDLTARTVDTANTHGSGDTLSAAVCAYLARGAAMPAAVVLAHAFTQRAIGRAINWRLGAGHGPVAQMG
jgi:hydroxymethylpyrimidine/phosphomethylpyrimidine kinase